jgi:hypothetical protein
MSQKKETSKLFNIFKYVIKSCIGTTKGLQHEISPQFPSGYPEISEYTSRYDGC